MSLFRLNEEACCPDHCVTPGVSTSYIKNKKGEADASAIVPNRGYDHQYDGLFVGDGDKAETSKTNIPAILAAKTAGGVPHPSTLKNGANSKLASDVFKLRKLTDDEYTPY